MREKFDINFAVFSGKNAWPSQNYPVVYELQEHHGVDLGHAYKTKHLAISFRHYIPVGHCQDFIQTLSKTSCFSFLMDGSTDKGNVDGSWSSQFKYIPKKTDADGLMKCLGNVLKLLGVDNILDKASVLQWKPILVSGGATVTVSHQNGMRGKPLKVISWHSFSLIIWN